MSTSTAIFTPKEALFRDFLTWEHILESFKLSESVSTFILSWKLSLLDLICSQLSENALRAKSCVFCHFWSFETLAFFTFCWFWPSRSHWRPFLDLESTKALWLSYPNLFLHLIYLYPFPCAQEKWTLSSLWLNRVSTNYVIEHMCALPQRPNKWTSLFKS